MFFKSLLSILLCLTAVASYTYDDGHGVGLFERELPDYLPGNIHLDERDLEDDKDILGLLVARELESDEPHYFVPRAVGRCQNCGKYTDLYSEGKQKGILCYTCHAALSKKHDPDGSLKKKMMGKGGR